MNNEIQAIIGDYQAFFSDLLHRLTISGIDVQGMPLVQLLYRTSTLSEYEAVRDALRSFTREFVETEFNGRPIAILILKTPLELGNGFSVDMIELAAPRPTHMYASGLESVGIFVGKKLPAFKKRYKKELTGVKKHGVYCQPAFITFDNGKTVKFYDRSLKEIVLLQGWYFEQSQLSSNAPVNKRANLVNAWLRYLYTIADWQSLIKESTQKETGCGSVYEVRNPLDRPNESFAIADMRKLLISEPHYHKGETEIYFVLKGKGLVVVGGKEIPVQENSVVVTPPETAHFIIGQKLVLGVVNIPAFTAAHVVAVNESNKKVKFDKKQFERLVREK